MLLADFYLIHLLIYEYPRDKTYHRHMYHIERISHLYISRSQSITIAIGVPKQRLNNLGTIELWTQCNQSRLTDYLLSYFFGLVQKSEFFDFFQLNDILCDTRL